MRGRSLGIVWLVAALVGVGLACSGFEEAPASPDADASIDADAATTGDGGTNELDGGADVASPRCSHDAPFTSFHAIDGVNSPGRESHLRLTNDELVIYFSRQPQPEDGFTVYRAERAKRTDAFGAPQVVPGIPIGAGRAIPFIGELETVYMVFGQTERTITVARRPTKDVAFSPGEAHALESSLEDRDFPFFSKDRREAFYMTYSTTSLADIGRASFDDDGGVAASEILDTLNTTANESDVVLSVDGLALYFYSDRSSAFAEGSIFVAQRDTPTSAFRTPRRIDELLPDGGTYTAPGFVSEDGCRLYYYADPSPTTAWDLFVAERTPK